MIRKLKDLHVNINFHKIAMKKQHIIILLVLFFSPSTCYDTVNEHNQIMGYYEEWSFMPIIHVYYNRHFSKSKQFNNFVDVVEEAEYQVGPYSKILFTDCQAEKSDSNFACKQIKRLNQNRMIIGYIPSNEFTSFGDKVMQSPPKNKVFDHFSDIYTAEEIIRFAKQMVPNFYKQISNTQQFEEFKKPRYSPKLIYATKQGQVSQVIKQLGVQFFLNFDMAYVQDLTQSVINQLEITKFPSLVILKHNYELDKLEVFNCNSHDFSEGQYLKIKRFLQTHALKQKRNDYMFHLIRMPSHPEIITVDKSSDLAQILDRIQSWVFIQEGYSYDKLIELKNKFGNFYQYIHYLKPGSTDNTVTLMNHRLRVQYQYKDQNIRYKTMNADQFQSNSTIWLRRDYVVVGVRESHGYLCTIVDKALFAGLAHCFIIEQQSYDKVGELMGMKFQYGFVVSANQSSNKVHGNQIKNIDFESIYRLLEYTTKMKVKEIIDDFIQNPVKTITTTTTIQDLCAQPYKKCILYFSEKSSDQTKKEYLELQAVHFVNQYKIFEVDLSCNKHMYDQIPQFTENQGGLIAYHPRLNKFVYLKAKMTRNVIRKFLQINNQDKKALPFKQFSSQKIAINHCIDSQKQSNEQQQFNSQVQL